MAIDEKYIELINADIDNEIDESDREALSAFLEENEEARILHAELATLCRRLDDVEQMEPPEHLKYAILDSFKTESSAAVPPEPFWRQLVAMPLFKHAAAFAAGVIMTFALISSNQISDSAFDNVTGLVGTISDADLPPSDYNSVSLARQDLAGTVSVHKSGSLTVVDFNLSTKDPVEVIAGFSERDLWFRGFAQLENDDANVITDEGEVRVRMKGRNRYAIYLQQASKTPAAIHLQFYAGGSLVHEAELRTDSPGTEGGDE